MPRDKRNFCGIEHRAGQAQLLDGSMGRNWFYGIGMRKTWGNGWPGDRVRETQVELWIWPETAGGELSHSAADGPVVSKDSISSTIHFDLEIEALPGGPDFVVSVNDTDYMETDSEAPLMRPYTEFFSESVRGALYDMLDNIEFEDITIDAIQAGSVIVDYTIQVVPQWSSRVLHTLEAINYDPSLLVVSGVAVASMAAPVLTVHESRIEPEGETVTVTEKQSTTGLVVAIILLIVSVVACSAFAYYWWWSHRALHAKTGAAERGSESESESEDEEKTASLANP